MDIDTSFRSLCRDTVDKNRERYLSALKEMVNIECGTEMVDGVNEVVGLVEKHLSGLGLKTERKKAEGFGDHLVATTGLPGKQIVLGGHLDTTYSDYEPLPEFHVDGDRAVGPGASDMKGGVVVFLAALDCLKAAGKLRSIPVTVLLNSDEERGAPTGREMFKAFAPNTKAALFSECGGPKGELVIARRGKISYRIDVEGADMHAGDGQDVKRSALLGLAHMIIEFEAMNEQFEGTAVNLGRAWGGVASNTVPGRATGLLDIRYPKSKQESELRTCVEAICGKAFVPGVTARAVETSYRPVWDRPEPGRSLTDLVETIMGETEIIAEPRAGTADSNWFGAVGVPTLDGLGGIGFEEHTKDEWLLLPTMFERMPMVAELILAIHDTLER